MSDLGGPEDLSEGQRQLARRAATIAISCEAMEAKALNGEKIDLDLYGVLSDRLGRTFNRLGLKRTAKDVMPTMTVERYLRQRHKDEDSEGDDD